MIRLLFSMLRNAQRLLRARRARSMVLLFASLIVYGVTGFLYFEMQERPELTFLDALWWSIVTMTTVGYGDLFPITTGGRWLVGMPTMLVGISILGYILSVSATAMIESKMREVRGMKPVHVKKHVVICHFGSLQNIQMVIREIRRDEKTASAPIVIVDDAIDELPTELIEEGIHFVKGDPARDSVLAKANIPEAQAVIILADMDDRAGSDNKNLHIALSLDHFFPNVYTVVECLRPDMQQFFRRANVDSVVCIAALTAQMVVQEVQDPGVGGMLADLTSNREGQQFFIVPVQEAGGTYGSLRARAEAQGCLMVGLRRRGRSLLAPASETLIEDGDKAVLIADDRPAMV